MKRKGTAVEAALPATLRKRRCAVYTRKSTEEGLDQVFNSLDAQRDACETFIASQRAEGWVLVPDNTTMGASRGARWSVRPCSGLSRTSRPGWWTWWWSTRSTASAAR